MTIAKARIDIEKGSGIGTGDHLPCMFNPTEFTITKGATWSRKQVQGKGQPEMRFISATSGTFSLNLTFDTTNDGTAVTNYTDLLLRLIEPNKHFPSPDAKTKRPPFVWFSWGQWRSFKAVVSNVAVTFTYFSSDGKALRANANVSFMQPEEDEAWPLQNPTSHTPLPHRIHRVQRGESIDRIASTYYNDPTDWRRIAEANHLTDAIRLTPGSLLIIPKRTAADA